MGSHFLLQGIFPSQGSNPGLLHCRQILYCLSHQGSKTRGQNYSQRRCDCRSRYWSDVIAIWKEAQAKTCRLPLDSEKGKEMDFSFKPPKKYTPVNTMLLAHWHTFWPSGLQNSKIITLYCFQLLIIYHNSHRMLMQAHTHTSWWQGTTQRVEYRQHTPLEPF